MEKLMTRRKRNKLVFGIGINDYDGSTYDENGKQLRSYKQWVSMLKRCYSPRYHEKQSTYIGCSVANEWLSYSNFKSWFDEYVQDNHHVDKDFLVTGNRMYSPENCVSLPQELNLFLINKRSDKGEWPTGTCYTKANRKFQARVRLDGKNKHLGYYEDPNEAHQAYAVAKQQHLLVLLERYQSEICPRVINRDMRFISILSNPTQIRNIILSR